MFRHISFNTLAPPKYSTPNDKKKQTISSKIDRVIAIYVLKNTDFWWNVVSLLFIKKKLYGMEIGDDSSIRKPPYQLSYVDIAKYPDAIRQALSYYKYTENFFISI